MVEVAGDALQIFEERALAQNSRVPAHVVLSQCLSGDVAASDGFAAQFRQRFGVEGLRKTRVVPSLQWMSNLRRMPPNAHIANLFTKRHCYLKPTREHVDQAIRLFAEDLQRLGAVEVVTPTMACGIDGHQWEGPGGVRATLLATISRYAPAVSRITIVRYAPPAAPAASRPPQPASAASSAWLDGPTPDFRQRVTTARSVAAALGCPEAVDALLAKWASAASQPPRAPDGWVLAGASAAACWSAPR